MLFWALPFNALLEGCNQVAAVNYFRLTQTVASSLALWLALAAGLGLWAAVAAAAVSVVRDMYLLLVRYRGFFARFLHPPEDEHIRWRTDIWPMQWRLAVSGLFGYFAFSLFNPVLFHYHGPVLAGQMGMTLALATALQGIATAWIQPRIPRFGMLIARKEYAELDALFFRTSAVALAIFACSATLLWAGVAWVHAAGHPFGSRILPPLATAMLFITTALVQVSVCLSVYLRAHKREPLVLLSVFFGASVGTLVWAFGSRYGGTGATCGYLVAVTLSVTWQVQIWRRCRAEWHV
jgi:O-antigen/teichoic acid export membrane protein